MISYGTPEQRAFTTAQAKAAGEQIGIDWSEVPFTAATFAAGMNVELEHGTADPQTNVTEDDPVTTAKIALAHLKESGQYYKDLAAMEAREDESKDSGPA